MSRARSSSESSCSSPSPWKSWSPIERASIVRSVRCRNGGASTARNSRQSVLCGAMLAWQKRGVRLGTVHPNAKPCCWGMGVNTGQSKLEFRRSKLLGRPSVKRRARCPAGTAPRPWGADIAGAPFALSARGHPRRRQHCSAQNGGSIHDRAVHCMETAQHSLKRTPRFRIAPRGGQNGARPGYRAILHGECALGALEGRFWFPSRSGHIGGRPPTQGVHPSAVEALGVPSA
eukprot:scaffold281_cov84-Phaeocystis_antarctica.AAC.1